MRLQKISYIGRAPKLSESGEIEFTLWVDEAGSLYVQMLGNAASGTFTDHVASVAKYASLRKSKDSLGAIDVVNPETGSTHCARDNNNSAFLKAILQYLLPG